MARIGETPCWNPKCSCTDAAVHRTTAGKLHIQCHKCGAAPWGSIGTKAHRDIMEMVKLDEPEQHTPAPASPEPVKVEPTKKPKNSVFALGDLG